MATDKGRIETKRFFRFHIRQALGEVREAVECLIKQLDQESIEDYKESELFYLLFDMTSSLNLDRESEVEVDAFRRAILICERCINKLLESHRKILRIKIFQKKIFTNIITSNILRAENITYEFIFEFLLYKISKHIHSALEIVDSKIDLSKHGMFPVDLIKVYHTDDSEYSTMVDDMRIGVERSMSSTGLNMSHELLRDLSDLSVLVSLYDRLQENDWIYKSVLIELISVSTITLNVINNSIYSNIVVSTQFRDFDGTWLTGYPTTFIESLKNLNTRCIAEFNNKYHVSKIDKDELNFDKIEIGKRIGEILPVEQYAPIYFEIIENILTVSHEISSPAESDREVVLVARATLISQGRYLMNLLQFSNVDGRLMEPIATWQEKLEKGEDIVGLGLLNTMVEKVTVVVESEISNIVLAILRAQTISIGMYVAQFPEWVRFFEKAAPLRLTIEDFSQIDNAVAEVIDMLLGQEQVHDEVPAILKALRLGLSGTDPSARRVAYGLVKTVENMVAKIIGHCLDVTKLAINQQMFDGNLLDKSNLIKVALTGAHKLASLSERLSGSNWMGEVAELVEKAMEEKRLM